MKILLINPNNLLEKILGSGKIFASPDVPMGLLYIASYLQKFGYNVILHDSYLHNDDYEDIITIIKDYNPNIIGISCLTANGKFVFELGQIIKQKYPEKLLVLGNLHASIFSNFYLKNKAADIIVHGEGEVTLYEICEAIKNKTRFEEIKGISFISENKNIVNNINREFIKELDMLPFPYPDNFDILKYPRMRSTRRSFLRIVSSRGCVNKCTFCSVHNGKKYRTRSVDNVIEEILLTNEKYNINVYSFEDPLFTADKKRIIKLCEKIIKYKLNIKWVCEGHINYIDEELLKFMKRAGCNGIAFGIESGNQAILDKIKKNTNLKDIEEKIVLTKKYINRVIGLFIIGLPGETEETIKDTLKLSLKLPLSAAQFALFTPYPGCQLYKDLINQNKIIIDENNIQELIDSWERYSSYAIFSNNAPYPIYIPDGFTFKELKRYQKKALKNFYFRLSYLLRNRFIYLNVLSLKDTPFLFKSIFRLFK